MFTNKCHHTGSSRAHVCGRSFGLERFAKIQRGSGQVDGGRLRQTPADMLRAASHYSTGCGQPHDDITQTHNEMMKDLFKEIKTNPNASTKCGIMVGIQGLCRQHSGEERLHNHTICKAYLTA